VPIEAYIRIPHYGPANFSIVDTKSNTIVANNLLYWSDYADGRLATLPANNTAFAVTIPDLGDSCTVAGECVSSTLFTGSIGSVLEHEADVA
jgi:hypothetical protein